MSNQLEEFEKKLYKRDSDQVVGRKNYEQYKEDNPFKVRPGWMNGRRKFYFVGSGLKVLAGLLFLALFAGAVMAGYFYLRKDAAFDVKKVVVTIDGPENISSGDEVSFIVTYRNNAGVTLNNSELTFEWPELSVISGGIPSGLVEKYDFGSIVPSQEKTAMFKGRLYGVRGQDKTVKVKFKYTPENINLAYEGDASANLKIVSTPLALKLTAPSQVVLEKEINMNLEYQNQSDADFIEMAVKIAYPSGFNFISSDPQPSSENNMWEIGTLKGKANGAIKIKGNFSGAQGEMKSIYAEIGRINKDEQFNQYAVGETQTTIASSALVVFQTVNGSRDYSTNPGANLRYKIRYKNTTNQQISNAVILAGIDTAFVDIKSLNIQWGAFDARTNSIIWNSVGVPDLAVLNPKQEGEVSFSINVKPAFLPKVFSDKNFTIASTAKITSSTPAEQLGGLPVEGSDSLEVKINTQFSFHEKAYYKDGVIQNFGPIPPKVDEKTSYAISWQLTNTINDTDGVEVVAFIPPTVEWTGVFSPQDADISYNPDTGQVKWRVPKVFAGAGILMPVQKVDFQLAFTPALVHVGSIINLISEANLITADNFTGMKIERSAPQVNSDLLNSIKEGGRVSQ